MTGESAIVAEIRRRRSELSRRYGHDLARYEEHLREVQREYAGRLVSQVTVVPSDEATEKPGNAGQAD